MRKIVLFFVVVILLIATAAQAEVVLYLNFEENATDQAAGVVRDQSSYGNDGLRETAWAGYALPQYTISHDGSQALQFGYDDVGTMGNAWNLVSVDKDASIAQIGTMFSMAFWVRVDMVTPWQNYFDYPKIISCPNYEIDLHATGDPASYFWPWDEDGASPPEPEPNWDFVMGNTGPYEGSWMHMVVTYDGTTFVQYINGAPVFSKNDFSHQFDDTTWDQDWGGGEPYWTNIDLTIGAHANKQSMNGYLAGLLDDVVIWGNCYLEPDMVTALYGGADPLTVTCVPEPATLLLLGLGGVLLRRKKA